MEKIYNMERSKYETPLLEVFQLGNRISICTGSDDPNPGEIEGVGYVYWE